MSFKEYYRLAKLSLKERKKSTRTTVRGLAVGAIILLPIIVCLFGINFSFNRQLNEKPYLLYYSAENMSDYRIEMDNYQNAIVSGSKNISFFENNTKNTSKIVYEIDYLIGENYSTTKYNINNSDWQTINGLDTKHFSIIDIDKSDSFFPENLTKKFPNGIFMEGYNQGFTNDGKKQVVVAEKMLDALGINADDIYQKPLSIRSDSYKDHINHQEPFTAFTCKDYIVVGIIKKEVSKLYEAQYYQDYNNLMNANLFFTSINVYQNQEGMLKPNLTTLPEVIINKESVSISGSFEYSYKNFDSKEALNEEYMMLGSYGCIHSFSKLTFFNTNIYIESNNYSNLTSSFNKTERYMDTILKTKALFPLKKSDMFQKYQFVYDIITSASLVFLIVACIIMFSAIINIYVTIKHSIKQRAFFLTMLRAIGAKDSTLPKLYMMESSIIVTRANILFVAIGFIITSVIKILIDNALTINNVSYNLSISWLSIIICMLVIIAFLYSVAFIFSFMGIYKLSKKPIMSILNEH